MIYRTSPNQFILVTLDRILFPHLVEEGRVKPGLLRTSLGNISTVADLKQVI